LRKEEALSIAVGLCSEMLLLRQEMARLAGAVASRYYSRREIDAHFLAENKIPEPVLFQALAPKIGLLPPKLAVSIAEFYQRLKECAIWLLILVQDDTRGYQYSYLPVLKPATNGVRNVLGVLKEIETMGGLPKIASELDLTNVDEVIELEELTFSDRS
jgi:hypothetical protein